MVRCIARYNALWDEHNHQTGQDQCFDCPAGRVAKQKGAMHCTVAVTSSPQPANTGEPLVGQMWAARSEEDARIYPKVDIRVFVQVQGVLSTRVLEHKTRNAITSAVAAAVGLPSGVISIEHIENGLTAFASRRLNSLSSLRPVAMAASPHSVVLQLKIAVARPWVTAVMARIKAPSFVQSVSTALRRQGFSITRRALRIVHTELPTAAIAPASSVLELIPRAAASDKNTASVATAGNSTSTKIVRVELIIVAALMALVVVLSNWTQTPRVMHSGEESEVLSRRYSRDRATPTPHIPLHKLDNLQRSSTRSVSPQSPKRYSPQQYSSSKLQDSGYSRKYDRSRSAGSRLSPTRQRCASPQSPDRYPSTNNRGNGNSQHGSRDRALPS